MRGATLRLGRRSLRRDRGRHALVVGLITVVVAVAALVAIAGRSTRVPELAWIEDQFGAVADARVGTIESRVAFADLPEDLQQAYLDLAGTPPPTVEVPPIPDLVVDVVGEVPLLGVHETTRAELSMTALDLTDPLADGLFLVDGPAPMAGEALLSSAAMRRLGVGVGDPVDLPEVGTVTVVGRVARPSRYAAPLAVLPSGSLGAPNSWLVDAGPGGARALERAVAAEHAAAGGDGGRWAAIRPDVASTTPNLARRVAVDPATVGALIGALLGLQLGLVAAAAFATGARRRLREYGLLGATGATPGQVRAVVLAEAGVLGVIAAGLGVGAALGLAGPLRPLVESLTGREVIAVRVAVLDLLAPAAVGVLAAVGAALWPSRTLARTPATSALAGRMPTARVPRWASAAALLTMTVGVAVLVVSATTDRGGLWPTVGATVGILLTGLGAASLGVPLLGLAGRIGARLGLGARLAARDAARQRTRSAAAVAALVAVFMLPAVVLTVAATEAAVRDRPEVATAWVSGPHLAGVDLPVTPDLLAEVEDLLPVDPVATLRLAQLDAGIQQIGADGPSGLGPLYVATEDLVAELGLDEDARRHLEAGGVVALGEGEPARARILLSATGMVEQGSATQLGRDVDVVTVPHAGPLEAGVLVPPAVAEPFGPTRGSVLLELPRDLTEAEADRVYGADLLATVGLPVDVSGPPAHLIALAGALGLALLVVAMTTALAASESDRDLQVMTAVGAGPGMRRRFHALQSLLHTGLGAALGIPTGLLLLAVGWDQRGALLVVPWTWLVVLAVAVPGLVAGSLWAVMRPARPATGRRIT